MTDKSRFRDFLAGFRWQGVDRLAYKEEGSAPFKDITRQVLFADPALGCELRYFEMAAGGYSTLERHEHVHAVMIFRGRSSWTVVRSAGRSSALPQPSSMSARLCGS